ADLDSASLIGANLAEVTLTDADLSFADLDGANLTGANLTGANLSRAYLTDAVWPTDAAVPGGWQRESGSGQLAGIASAPVNVGELPHYARKYLFPTERIFVAERMHPITILAPAVWILAGTFIAGFVTWATPLGNAQFVEIIWLVWALLAVWSCWKIANWWRQYFVVTDRRMMLVAGILNRTIDMMPLAKVTDMTVHQSRFGHVFGYGDFIIESAGQRQALSRVVFVPHPTQRFREIVALLFAGTAGRDEGAPAS